jgi:hypothetical protein
MATSMEEDTFLHYLASGGYHRPFDFSVGVAKSTAILHTQEVANLFMTCMISVPNTFLFLSQRNSLNFPSHRILQTDSLKPENPSFN